MFVKKVLLVDLLEEPTNGKEAEWSTKNSSDHPKISIYDLFSNDPSFSNDKLYLIF